MRIAVIGAGNVGSALASSCTRAGHDVVVASRDASEAEALAAEVGCDAAPDTDSAVRDAEVVILAVPYPELDSLVSEAGAELDGKIVVDVTNRMDPDDMASTIDGTSAAEQLQAKLPRARVVKAFNTAFASRQAEPEVDGTAPDGFVAGDDADAKRRVLELVEQIGFRPIDAGPLAMARALEAMAVLNISLQIANGWSWQMAWKLIGPA